MQPETIAEAVEYLTNCYFRPRVLPSDLRHQCTSLLAGQMVHGKCLAGVRDQPSFECGEVVRPKYFNVPLEQTLHILKCNDALQKRCSFHERAPMCLPSGRLL